MDVASWLRSLGLEEYEAAFRDNKINERVLPNLTQEDLKEIGVGPVGHRRIILEAIATLRAATSGKASPADAATTSTAPSVSPEDRAERRQVTVMFSDLVGSTALSARMDPEDLREVISGYQKCVSETVQRFGGFVAKYMGDGVLVYFGYPQAHEDDAERAVRAGLELVAAVGALRTHAALQTRVGIATGLVVVGDLIGSGASQEQAIVGETPNLAARLQGVAEPNRVVLAESTQRLIGNLFELEDLGAQDLKGVEGPARAWAALRPSSLESRFEALHASGAIELVGREEELELLLRRWSKAKAGEGQVILLSGEPGIGKSRLTAALLERIAPEPHTRLRYFCSPQRTDSALYPIISQMERAAGFTHADTGQMKLDKLDAVLVLSSTSRQDAALFAEMLSMPNDGRYPTLELTPQQRRQKTLEALFTQVQTFARKNPVLMIFEDTHWSDPTSLEAFGRMVNRVATLPVLLLITFRPEFEPPWIGQPHVTALTLNRMTRHEVDAMIGRMTRRAGPQILEEPVYRSMSHWMLQLDPPDHGRLRSLVVRAFSARRIEDMRPRIQAIVDDIINDVEPRGHMDLIADFAYRLPVTVICDMLGIPEGDREIFHAGSRTGGRLLDLAPLSPAEIQQQNAFNLRMADYFQHLFDLRRRQPSDDLTTHLVQAEEAGDKLTNEELTANIILLFGAGHETTVNLIGNGLLALHRNPDQLHLLRDDPSLAPNAVEELLRYDSSVQVTGRTTLEDVDEIGGIPLAKGQSVVCLLGSANRDPAVYVNPDNLDIRRTDIRPLSFGGGIHYCVGAQLARLEGEIAINTLLRRLPNLRIDDIEHPDWRQTFVLRGLNKLPAIW